MSSSGRLSGKVGVITGAARGIGAGIARAMAAQGAALYVCDVDVSSLDSVAQEIGATAIKLDVTSEADWSDLAARLDKDHGRLDILVHNAGTEVVKPLDQQTAADVSRVLAVNLEGPMTGCRVMQPLLSASGKLGAPSSVINISSIAALIGQADLSAYSVSKAAIAHLSKVLAVEWMAHGHIVRVNTILPGCIMTPMLAATVNEWIEGGILNEASAWATIADLCPMRTIGEVNDIAMGAVYLASDESKFVTGIQLIIDGGQIAK